MICGRIKILKVNHKASRLGAFFMHENVAGWNKALKLPSGYQLPKTSKRELMALEGDN